MEWESGIYGCEDSCGFTVPGKQLHGQQRYFLKWLVKSLPSASREQGALMKVFGAVLVNQVTNASLKGSEQI